MCLYSYYIKCYALKIDEIRVMPKSQKKRSVFNSSKTNSKKLLEKLAEQLISRNTHHYAIFALTPLKYRIIMPFIVSLRSNKFHQNPLSSNMQVVLEMLCGETHLGFESLTLRQKSHKHAVCGTFFILYILFLATGLLMLYPKI